VIFRVLTKHPDLGKQGVRISKAKYDLIRRTILDLLRANGEITFTQLANAVNERLEGKFDGSISWYVITVKLDLEARNVIERVPKSKPQRLRMVTG
jgi:DNA-binding Lrp family transcriptional regulator